MSKTAAIKGHQLTLDLMESGSLLKAIRSLLAPMENTRLDQMIDIVFTAAKDVEAAVQTEQPEHDESEPPMNPGETSESSAASRRTKGVWQFTDTRLLDKKRLEIVDCFSRKIATAFVKKSRALFWDSGHQKRIACTISKRYTRKYPYWYAYHPEWDEFVSSGNDSFVILGCMDLPFAFALPWKVLHSSLDGLYTTTTKEHTYWHVHLVDAEPRSFGLLLPKKSSTLPLDEYRLALKQE
jgi:hypothetical protein